MDNTQDKIIQATIEWIETDDYTQLSMRKLAQKIKMTTGAIYKYFQNKDELFYQVSIILSQQVSQKLVINSEASAKDKLLLLADGFCQLSQRKPKLVNFLFFNPSLHDFYHGNSNYDFKFYNQVMDLVYEVNPGGVTDQQFFVQIWSFIQGYSLLILNKTVNYDSNLVERTLNEMIRGSKK
ncbi:TetR/AcrR family transcriptional regulator [Limosilactobacillus portuensis]|uniref:TetR/AcrR family transcriptional regulator n=1 Tax=Limosilactobacillus portuensis TaxID=2742601 RepID=UPI003D720A63